MPLLVVSSRASGLTTTRSASGRSVAAVALAPFVLVPIIRNSLCEGNLCNTRTGHPTARRESSLQWRVRSLHELLALYKEEC